jgi:histidinol phosphatase-like PHP family hydrolase
MKIDLHVHSSERSGCATATDEAMICAAISAGLDGFFFTDHHRFIPPEKLLPLNQQFTPFRVFRGIEITCAGEDFLVLGVPDAGLERDDWQYPDLHHFVRERNGFIVLAHPFRYREIIAVDCEAYRPDAIEICSANTPVHEQDRIRELAAKWNIPTLSNSDAHSTDRLGTYFNILDETPSTESGILDLLRAGRFRCQNCSTANGGSR